MSNSQIDTEREEFEHWFLDLNYDFRSMDYLSKRQSGDYFYTQTQALYSQFRRIRRLEKAVDLAVHNAVDDSPAVWGEIDDILKEGVI